MYIHSLTHKPLIVLQMRSLLVEADTKESWRSITSMKSSPGRAAFHISPIDVYMT